MLLYWSRIDLSRLEYSDLSVRCNGDEDLTYVSHQQVDMSEIFVLDNSTGTKRYNPLSCSFVSNDTNQFFSEVLHNQLSDEIVRRLNLELYGEDVSDIDSTQRNTCALPVIVYDMRPEMFKISQLGMVMISKGQNIFEEDFDTSNNTHCNNGTWPVYSKLIKVN